MSDLLISKLAALKLRVGIQNAVPEDCRVYGPRFCNHEVSLYLDSRLQAACFILWIKNPHIHYMLRAELHAWLVPEQMSNGYHDNNLEQEIWTYFIKTRHSEIQQVNTAQRLAYVATTISLFSPPKTSERILQWISDCAV